VILALLSFLAAFTTVGTVLFLVGSVALLFGLALYGRDRGILG